MAHDHPRSPPPKRPRSSSRSSAMVRSEEAEPVAGSRPKRRPQLLYSPASTPPPPPSPPLAPSPVQSTVPTVQRRRSRRNISPLPMVVDSPANGDAHGRYQRDVEMVTRRHPDGPSKPFPGFQPGNLVLVRMQDFLTFTDTTIRPGPRMNLVIGPNGTGKSTIANAVCIVFGGSPKLLGRNTDLGSFVRHGRTKATIEAHLFDPTARMSVRVVKRVFDADGKSQFFLDGEKAAKGDIAKKVIRRFDIQLDNLSQFMPQEKIQEFTNFRPDELLSITVRSLGGADKERVYRELTELDSTIGSSAQDLERKEAKLAELNAKHEAEAEEVQAYVQQQEARKKLKLYKKYLPFLEARDLKEDYMALLRQRKTVEEEYIALEEKIKSANQGPINEREQELDAASAAARGAKNVTKEAEREAMSRMATIEDLSLKLSQKSKELQDKEASASRRRKALQEAEQKLERMERQCAEASEDVKELRETEELQELTERKGKIRSEEEALRAEHNLMERKRLDASRSLKYLNMKLNGLGDARQERIRALEQKVRSNNLGSCEALIREMAATKQFRGQVCGPVGAEIEVNDQYHARIMEAALSGFFMFAFVTEHASDSRILIDACRRKFNGWVPDVITVPTTRQDEIDTERIRGQVPRRPVDARLRELGVDRTVNDIYECPNPVRAALNAQLGLHNMHVGNEHSDRCKDDFLREAGIDTWFTPTTRCQLVSSRYDPTACSMRVEHQFANQRGTLFAASVQSTDRERDRLLVLIREEEGKRDNAGKVLTDNVARQRSLSESLQKADASIRDNKRRRETRRQLAAGVERHKQFVEAERRRADEYDLTSEKVALAAEIRQLEEEAAGSIPSVTEGLSNLRACMRRLDEQNAIRINADRALHAEMARYSAVENGLKEKQEQRDASRLAAREAKSLMRMRQAEAEQSLSKKELQDDREMFEQLDARDSEWLRDEIAHQAGRVAGLATGGEETILRYEKRQRLIEQLTNDLQRERSQHDSKLSELRNRKAEFLGWLTAGVDKMRTKFSALYRRLGCAGDLELINTDGDSIGNIELQILVSYRDNVQLRPISASANSGGEKMCCTMLFVFSLLQEEERMPPFVFVDELNQGLDPSNELKIMTMMFEDAENTVAPQSFVITPKLLLNLPFHSRTKTHIIFNGSVSGKLDVTAPQVV